MTTAGSRVEIGHGESRGGRPVARAQHAAFKKIPGMLASRVCPEMLPALR